MKIGVHNGLVASSSTVPRATTAEPATVSSTLLPTSNFSLVRRGFAGRPRRPSASAGTHSGGVARKNQRHPQPAASNPPPGRPPRGGGPADPPLPPRRG